jgi:hypothetical protein
VIADVVGRKPMLADVFMDLDADDDLRPQFEIELLRSSDAESASATTELSVRGPSLLTARTPARAIARLRG